MPGDILMDQAAESGLSILICLFQIEDPKLYISVDAPFCLHLTTYRWVFENQPNLRKKKKTHRSNTSLKTFFQFSVFFE